MKTLRKEDLEKIGFVNKTSGFKGALSCYSDLEQPEGLLKNKFFFLLMEGLPVPFAIQNIEMKGEEIIVKFEEIDSESDAKKFIRKEIYVEKIKGRKNAKSLIWDDLLNYTAIDNTFGEIGIITGVFELPMQMIARCIHDGKEILFPLNEDIITSINDDEMKIFVDLPDGLLDIYLK